MKEYTGAIYTTTEDMFKTYDLAKLINTKLTPEAYKKTLEFTTSVSNYKQYVVLFSDKPVSFCGFQDKLVMSLAPDRCVELSNGATDPEHRGVATNILGTWVERELAKDGIKALHIRSQKTNERATACYEKYGFDKDFSFAWVKKIESEPKMRAKL